MSVPFSGACITQFNEILGRYLVADKDFKPGETIFKEEALILSPLWESQPRCAHCFRECSTKCKLCKVFPLCFQCKVHDHFDCKFMCNGNFDKEFLIDNFSAYAPLKTLLYLERSQIENFLQFESHETERRGTEIWRQLDKSAVKPIMEYVKGSFKNLQLDEELIQKICGIFDVNAFEVRGPESGDVLRAIFPLAALLAHSCVANTLISVDDSYQLKIYATCEIKKGDIIYNNYTNPLMGTAERRRQLKMGKYFFCECKRCIDPTELGTHMSSIVCTNCSELVVPLFDNEWQCRNCLTRVDSNQIKELLKQARQDTKNADNDIRLMEMFILQYSKILNPNHFFIIDIKQNIASILRVICMNAPSKPGKGVLTRKIQLCDEIMPVLMAIHPGISRLVGIALYEKFVPVSQLAKIEYENLEISSSAYLEKLLLAEDILKRSIGMLIYEQVQSAEGRLVKHALNEMKELRSVIKSIRNKTIN